MLTMISLVLGSVNLGLTLRVIEWAVVHNIDKWALVATWPIVYWIWMLCLVSVIFVYAYTQSLVGSAQRRILGLMCFVRQLLVGLCVYGVAVLIKSLTAISRPYAILDLAVAVGSSLNPTMSFPSMHAALYMYATCLLWLYRSPAWVRVLSLAMMLWITVSRVMVGYHYVGDLLVGWLLGYAAYRAVQRWL